VALEFVAPTDPGPNVTAWLYLTATNRTARGVEALIRYYQQEELRFMVFDWARSDHWQIDVGFGDVQDYISSKAAHGQEYQILSLQNLTYIKTGEIWTNEVRLMNYRRGGYDLIYSYDYTSNVQEQKTGAVGTWASIVETFQGAYNGIEPVGFLNTSLCSRDSSLTWSPWQPLLPGQSSVRNDQLGLRNLFVDPNYSFVVD
jgi:hypothetical protein